MKNIAAIFAFLFGVFFLAPAQMITLEEESTSGKFKKRIAEENLAIVDVNSIIRIKINNAILEEEMFRYQGVASNNPRLLKLNKLNELLRYQTILVKMIDEDFRNGQPVSLGIQKKFASIADAFMEQIDSDPEMAALVDNPEVDARFLADEGRTPYLLIVIDVLSEEADAVRAELQSQFGLNGKVDSSLLINFRLGAFIRNKEGGRPVHVENFDRLSPERYIEVERFEQPMSDEEKDAILNNKLINDTLQISALRLTSQFRGVLKAKVDNLFPSDSARTTLLQTFGSTYLNLSADVETRPAASILLKHELNLNRVAQLYDLIRTVYEDFSNTFPNGILQEGGLDRRLQEVATLIRSGYKAFQNDLSIFSSSGVTQGLIELNQIDQLYDNYVQSSTQDISAIQSLLDNVSNLLNPFRKSYLANEDFSEDVLRFTAGKVPSEGFIELKYIGERKAGDEILIKAIIERGKDERNPNYEQREVYRRIVHLYRIAPYFRMSGSLVLANPYNRSQHPAVAIENDFQFAPTYGIFMKWGSRKSKGYNEIVNFGLGLGFSSPDFNLDGTPEFGSGIMLTAFRDILSAGWGWNFGVDAPYTFIGFNIPFTIGGLPTASGAVGFN